MKNKGFFKTAATLLAALVLLGGFSVPAYAGGGEDIPTDDSGVIVETEPQPLTPDGNLSLIDDIEGEAAEEKQPRTSSLSLCRAKTATTFTSSLTAPPRAKTPYIFSIRWTKPT